jgi:hypothetical protein
MELGSRRVRPVGRGCLLLLGTWSHLRYFRRSVLAHLFIWLVIPTWISRLITLRYLGHSIELTGSQSVSGASDRCKKPWYHTRWKVSHKARSSIRMLWIDSTLSLCNSPISNNNTMDLFDHFVCYNSDKPSRAGLSLSLFLLDSAIPFLFSSFLL